MQRSQQSREFSDHINTNSHLTGDVFRRLMWIVSLVVVILTGGWLLWNAAKGSPNIYQPGPLTVAHQGLTDRCDACHTKFVPLQRLVSQGLNGRVTSAPDQKCVACHAGTGHYFATTEDASSYEQTVSGTNLIKHHKHHCSDCHSEHHSDQDLSRVASHFCIECHADLQQAATRIAQFDSPIFSSGIKSLDQHPEFATISLVTEQQGAFVPPNTHGAHSVVAATTRPKEFKSRWQDKAAIRFNHAKHLQQEGLFDAKGQRHFLKDNCQACHQPESDRMGMKPIFFERHCKDCHPLVFDVDSVRKVYAKNVVGIDEARSSAEKVAIELLVVPHRQAKVVRGYLTDFYAIQELSAVSNSDDHRARPGHAGLNDQQIRRVERVIADAEHRLKVPQVSDRPEPANEERSARNERLFGALRSVNRTGGCAFCHQINPADVQSTSSVTTSWSVQPPEIPDKWFVHARFDHDAHRFAKCLDCHTQPATDIDIFKSESTGDVLLPGIDVCRKCHSETATVSEGIIPARTDCIECHTYHKRHFETSPLNQILESGNLQ